jgi:hypothetical protein
MEMRSCISLGEQKEKVGTMLILMSRGIDSVKSCEVVTVSGVRGKQVRIGKAAPYVGFVSTALAMRAVCALAQTQVDPNYPFPR